VGIANSFFFLNKIKPRKRKIVKHNLEISKKKKWITREFETKGLFFLFAYKYFVN
jgi:hypothetical protein